MQDEHIRTMPDVETSFGNRRDIFHLLFASFKQGNTRCSANGNYLIQYSATYHHPVFVECKILLQTNDTQTQSHTAQRHGSATPFDRDTSVRFSMTNDLEIDCRESV